MTSLVYMFDPNPTYGSKHRESQAAQKVPFVDKLSYFSLNLAGQGEPNCSGVRVKSGWMNIKLSNTTCTYDSCFFTFDRIKHTDSFTNHSRLEKNAAHLHLSTKSSSFWSRWGRD